MSLPLKGFPVLKNHEYGTLHLSGQHNRNKRFQGFVASDRQSPEVAPDPEEGRGVLIDAGYVLRNR